MKIKILKNFRASKENLTLQAGKVYEFSKERITDFEENLPGYFEVIKSEKKEQEPKKSKKTPQKSKKGA